MKKLLQCFKCNKAKSSKLFVGEIGNNNIIGTINIEDNRKSFKEPEKDLSLGKLVEPNNDGNALIVEDEKKQENTLNTEDNLYTKSGLNTKNEVDVEENELMIQKDSPLICDYEKNIVFTKKGLIELFDNFWNLDNYKRIWDKENLIVELRNEGSPLNNQFQMVKIIYYMDKNEIINNADTSVLVDLFYNTKIRLMWDKIIKQLDVYEGNENFYILNTCANPPVFFMSERDNIEKKLIFNYKNSTYVMSSSIPGNIYPENKNVVRVINYVNYVKVSDEGENIVYYSISQTDFKMIIPQTLVNLTLPITTKGWLVDFKNFAKKAVYDKKTKTIFEKNED